LSITSHYTFGTKPSIDAVLKIAYILLGEMKKFGAVTILLTAAIIIAGALALTKPQSNTEKETPKPTQATDNYYEYYYGETCPHCANVSEFLETWDKKDQFNIEKLEVYNNQENATSLGLRARECGYDTTQIGVPFVYTPDGQCIIGDTPIIEYFQNL
jgi:glutaredoxin-related protein